MSEATVKCPGCGRPQTVSIKAMIVDIAAPSWQDTIANLSVEYTGLYESYRDIAERTETPAYTLLIQALDLALPEIRKQHGLCTFCGEALSSEE